ncbi:unnamed protein product [Brassica oleracea var. botrytis]
MGFCVVTLFWAENYDCISIPVKCISPLTLIRLKQRNRVLLSSACDDTRCPDSSRLRNFFTSSTHIKHDLTYNAPYSSSR